jgi:hypothetical protein
VRPQVAPPRRQNDFSLAQPESVGTTYNYDPELQKEYEDLAKRLRGRDQTNFEQLVGSPAIVNPVRQFPDAGSTEKLA